MGVDLGLAWCPTNSSYTVLYVQYIRLESLRDCLVLRFPRMPKSHIFLFYSVLYIHFSMTALFLLSYKKDPLCRLSLVKVKLLSPKRLALKPSPQLNWGFFSIFPPFSKEKNQIDLQWTPPPHFRTNRRPPGPIRQSQWPISSAAADKARCTMA